jgi:hypothetical protein
VARRRRFSHKKNAAALRLHISELYIERMRDLARKHKAPFDEPLVRDIARGVAASWCSELEGEFAANEAVIERALRAIQPLPGKPTATRHSRGKGTRHSRGKGTD